MTDQELLRAYVVGHDVQSLGIFLGRYQDSILRFVARLLRDDDVAQDVVQETFLRVARHPKPLLKVESCHNWLLRVARNIGMDHLRRVSRHRKHAESVARHAESSLAAAAAVAEPVAVVERQELQKMVRAEIDRLPPRQRELLLLRVQEKKSYKEIAEIAGLTATNVGFILHQAMKALSTRLKDPLEGDA